jgi:hypothetical protein
MPRSADKCARHTATKRLRLRAGTAGSQLTQRGTSRTLLRRFVPSMWSLAGFARRSQAPQYSLRSHARDGHAPSHRPVRLGKARQQLNQSLRSLGSPLGTGSVAQRGNGCHARVQGMMPPKDVPDEALNHGRDRANMTLAPFALQTSRYSRRRAGKSSMVASGSSRNSGLNVLPMF